MKKLKILHTNFNIGWGGQSNRVFNVCSGLIKLGHDVMLSVPENSDLKKKAAEHDIPLFTDVHFNSGFGFCDFKDYKKLKKLIENQEFDIVHTHGSKDTWVGVLASKSVKKKPIIVRTRHNIFPVKPHLLNQLLYRRLCNEIVVICEFLKSDLLYRKLANIGHITVIHSGLLDKAHNLSKNSNEDFREKFKIAQNEIIIGMCANLVWYKGHKYFALASGEINKKFPDSRFVVLGDGKKEIKDEILKIFTDQGISDKVIMPGFYGDLPAFYRSCDVLVHPALSEGCCNTILEAFSFGVPVVASNVGGIPDMVSDRLTGILVTAKDSQSISKAVIQILENKNFAKKLTQNARKKFLDEFTVEKMVDRIENLYFKTLNMQKS
jgi:glycosyltransferase involved in cell wall biosynthesis